MENQLQIIGGALLLLALLHSVFPNYFKWKEELRPLSLINRQMMYIHSFFIAMTVFGMGLLCLFFSHELVSTRLGRALCLGLGVFWTTRLVIQFFGYSPKNWRGKGFETMVHVLFVLFWGYLSVVFWVIAGK